ncbi:hypothetical protein O181_023434 [Austropuccinia psidii MF-1]|uniref:CCHC-type domain-containing protein n=1 Tax=Austropuccinia psidii MF-1 TaxID=1389203 RepID=A0A9Q3CED7_9BASI|nr:hypothetical protein [Austropuccinia psidii MF-1]
MEHILNILQQVSNTSNPLTNHDSLQLSKIYASRPPPFKGKHQFEGQNFTPLSTPSPQQRPFYEFNPCYSSSPISELPVGWKKNWPTPQNSCSYCGEVGHWEPDCPEREKAVHAQRHLSQPNTSVASLGAIPLLKNNEELLGLGETDSVVGNLPLFINVWHINMKLLVSSSH